MLEQVYADIIQEHTDAEDCNLNARTTKRRKINVSAMPSHASTPDGDDEDDLYYGIIVHGKGKKAKGGTGYAGDVKEDVSLIIIAAAEMRKTTENHLRLLGKSRLWPSNVRRMRR